MLLPAFIEPLLSLGWSLPDDFPFTLLADIPPKYETLATDLEILLIAKIEVCRPNLTRRFVHDEDSWEAWLSHDRKFDVNTVNEFIEQDSEVGEIWYTIETTNGCSTSKSTRSLRSWYPKSAFALNLWV